LRVAADRPLAEAGNNPGKPPETESATTVRSACLGARFAVTKFRPTPLPGTLVTRSALHDRLTAGAGQRLTLVAGSAAGGRRRGQERAAVELGCGTASRTHFLVVVRCG